MSGASLVGIVGEVCAAVGVEKTTSVFSNINNNRTMSEMKSLADEMAQRIAWDTREWNILKTTGTFVGDGVLVGNVMTGSEAFNLPADFKRMLKTGQVWRSTSALQPMRFYPDTDEWLQRRALNYSNAWGEWTIYGGKMHIWPIMAVGTTARFVYINYNFIDLASGGRGPYFQSDNDSFALDARMLKLGMIWQWKALKGSPYAEDMSNYETAIAMLAGADSPAPIIVGRLPISSSARMSYPFPIDPGMVPL